MDSDVGKLLLLIATFILLFRIQNAQSDFFFESELSTSTAASNETVDSNSTSIKKLDSHHEPCSKSNKLPVNWHYFTWPLIGSIILVSSIAWFTIRRSNRPRVLYMSRIPRIISTSPRPSQI